MAFFHSKNCLVCIFSAGLKRRRVRLYTNILNILKQLSLSFNFPSGSNKIIFLWHRMRENIFFLLSRWANNATKRNILCAKLFRFPPTRKRFFVESFLSCFSFASLSCVAVIDLLYCCYTSMVVVRGQTIKSFCKPITFVSHKSVLLSTFSAPSIKTIPEMTTIEIGQKDFF